jgi:hypothetical protein
MSGQLQFALAFVRNGDALLVLSSPSLRMADMRVVGTFRPDWAAVETAVATIRGLFQAANGSGTMDAASLAQLGSAGGWLFDELLPWDTKTLLRTGEGTLLLSLDPSLLHIPWECMAVGGEPIAARWAIGRLVQDDVDPSLRRQPSSPLRVHIIADPDGTLDDAYAEGEAVYQRFRRHARAQVAMRTADVDLAQLRQHLTACDIFHFAGHVDSDGLRLRDESFGAVRLQRLAGSGNAPSLVVLNGCAALAGDHWQDSLLQAWMRAGVSHVLGPMHEVPDRLGLLFAESFYRELLAGRAIGRAVQLARQAISRQVGPAAFLWGAYVLYGDPNQVYVPVVAAAARPLPTVADTTLAASSALRASATAATSPPDVQVPPTTNGSATTLIMALLLAVAILSGMLILR